MVRKALYLAIAALAGAAFFAVFSAATKPAAEAPPEKTEQATKPPDDDIPQRPHPDWKQKREDWIRRGAPYEATPIEPAKPYKTPCRFYRSDGCGTGGQCGAVAELAGGKHVYPAECPLLRIRYAKERGLVYPEPDNDTPRDLRDEGRARPSAPCRLGGCQAWEDE
jgi:hypothetical protein